MKKVFVTLVVVATAAVVYAAVSSTFVDTRYCPELCNATLQQLIRPVIIWFGLFGGSLSVAALWLGRVSPNRHLVVRAVIASSVGTIAWLLFSAVITWTVSPESFHRATFDSIDAVVVFGLSAVNALILAGGLVFRERHSKRGSSVES